MRLSRHELLQRLLMVAPGMSRRKSIAQSDCIVLRRGRLYTLSQEIACTIPSGLPKEWHVTIQAESLIETVKKMPGEDMEIDLEEGIMVLRSGCKSGRARLACEVEELLPVDDVERPQDSNDLPEEFSEAVELVAACTKSRKSGEDCAFLHECIHVTPEYMEACDNRHLARYHVATMVSGELLVRGESLRAIRQLGMTKISLTDNWLHFGNSLHLRMSIRRFAMEEYPDLGEFLKLRGREIVFPQALSVAAELAASFSDSDLVRVKAKPGLLVIKGTSAGREYAQQMKLKYQGPNLSFQVPSRLLINMVEKHAECEIGPTFLRVGNEHYAYMTSLIPEGD